jgi:hypothetical protein
MILARMGKKNVSAAGGRWLSSSLACLQRALVPLVQGADSSSPSCEKVEQFAFDTHAACYTGGGGAVPKGPSICLLHRDDTRVVMDNIDMKDLLSPLNVKADFATSEICLAQIRHIQQQHPQLVAEEKGALLGGSSGVDDGEAAETETTCQDDGQYGRCTFWKMMHKTAALQQEDDNSGPPLSMEEINHVLGLEPGELQAYHPGHDQIQEDPREDPDFPLEAYAQSLPQKDDD